jgi:hypothetical protein
MRDRALALRKHAVLPVEVHHPQTRDDEPGVILGRDALDLLVRDPIQRAPATQYTVSGDPPIRDHDRNRYADLLIAPIAEYVLISGVLAVTAVLTTFFSPEP